MSETKKQFTQDQIKAFEENYNLGVYSHEALIEVLMRQDSRIQQLEERLMEVSNNVPIGLCDTESPNIRKNSLADKWNK